MARREHDPVEVVDRRRPGREDGRPPTGERLDRPEAEVDLHDAPAERGRGRGDAAVHRQDEVADQGAVRVQPGLQIVGDEDPGSDLDGRDRRPAAVEDD